MTLVSLDARAHLHAEDGAAEWVYFPETCLLSLISSGADGQSVETAMVGNESAAGILEACSSERFRVDCVVQMEGMAWRAPASACRAMARSDAAFNAVLLCFAELQLAETRRYAYCQTVHPAQKRLARWLAEGVDRSGGQNPLSITQESLASILGVQRTSVSLYASELQSKGLIRYRRGSLAIVDRGGLNNTACPCRSYMVSLRKKLGFEVVDPVAPPPPP